jgi:hypothetical protein
MAATLHDSREVHVGSLHIEPLGVKGLEGDAVDLLKGIFAFLCLCNEEQMETRHRRCIIS